VAPKATSAPRQPKARPRRRWLILGGAGAGLVLAAAAVACVLLWGRVGQRPTIEEVPGTLSVQQASEKVGKRVTVEMKVRSVGVNRSATLFYLNSEENFRTPTNFTIAIPRESLGDVEPDVSAVRQTYADKRVRAVGIVMRDRRIEIDRPQRLTVVPEP